jgi:NADH:ubiquinone oxidoreductase subunit C
MSVEGQSIAPDVIEMLVQRFEASVDVDGPPRIPSSNHVALARALRDELGYRIFGFVIASHHPGATTEGGAGERLRVVYGLRDIGSNSRLAMWQVEVGTGESVPSLVGLFAGADWQEREQFDLVGVRFEAHPDLRRLMLSEDWKGHPLRKDYAIDTEVPPWR